MSDADETRWAPVRSDENNGTLGAEHAARLRRQSGLPDARLCTSRSICVPRDGKELTGRSVADVMDGDVIALGTAATLDACCRVVDSDVV